jgi:hypothetical protein
MRFTRKWRASHERGIGWSRNEKKKDMGKPTLEVVGGTTVPPPEMPDEIFAVLSRSPVTDKYEPTIAFSGEHARQFAMDYAGERAANAPAYGPWRVQRYVKAEM